jgi:hypothetical protein
VNGVQGVGVFCEACNKHIPSISKFEKHIATKTHKLRESLKKTKLLFNRKEAVKKQSRCVKSSDFLHRNSSCSSENIYTKDRISEEEILENLILNSCDSIDIKTTMDGVAFSVKLTTEDETVSFTPLCFLSYFQPVVEKILENFLKFYKRLKLYSILELQYSKSYVDFSDIEQKNVVESKARNSFCNSGFTYLSRNEDVSQNVFELLERLVNSSYDVEESVVNSGSCYDFVKSVELHIFPLNYIRNYAGCHYIPTPIKFAGSKAIRNIRNDTDNNCLKYSILAALNPDIENASLASSYKHLLSSVDFGNLPIPPTIQHFDQIEKLNNIRLNAFFCSNTETGEIIPLKISSSSNVGNPEIDLLLLSEFDKNTQMENYHWTCITSFNRFFRSLISNMNCQIFACKRCFTYFYRAEAKLEHDSFCKDKKAQLIEMPKSGSRYCFKNYTYISQHSHFISFDFESRLEKINVTSSSGKTVRVQRHVPISFAYCVIDEQENFYDTPYFFACENPFELVKHFFDRMLLEENNILNSRESLDFSISPTFEQIQMRQNAKNCYICKCEFSTTDLAKKAVIDHNHLLPNGHPKQFLGISCNTCNMNRQITDKIVVISHGGRNYDHKILLKYFPLKYLKEACGAKVSMLGKNLETVMSFTVNNLEFKDNLQYSKNSLANLVELLPDWTLIEKFCNHDSSKLDCIKRKQHFPYSFLDSYAKLSGPILPRIEEFQDEMSGERISETDYEELKNTLVTLGYDLEKSTFRDLLCFYNVLDSVHLAAVVLEFKKKVFENYKIEALNFISLPGISENACLLSTGASLELISDYSMHSYFQRACIGGLCQSGLRYCESNDPRIPETYKPNEPNSYIVMADVCALYPFSMSEYPHGYGNFRYYTEQEIDNFDIEHYDEFGTHGLLLSVDLFIDESLHDFLSLLPPLPMHMEITPDMLSFYSKNLLQMCNMKLGKAKRLVCTLKNVENYTIHASLLKLYVVLLKVQIVKIHKIIGYDQSFWLRDYINLNASLRRNAKSTHESNLYKTMSNSAYGRFLLRKDRFRNFKMITEKNDFIRAVNNPLFKHFVAVREDLILVEFLKKKTCNDSPIFVASSILSASKTKIFQFLYGTLCTSIGRTKIKFIYTDTDSLLVSIECEDLVKTLQLFQDELDTSNFPVDHPLYSLKNKKVPGKWVLEMGANAIKFACVLSSKAYAISVSKVTPTPCATQSIMKLRGFPQKTLRKDLKPENYRDALFNLRDMFKSFQFYRIDSKNSEIFTSQHKRCVLMCHYIKGIVLPNAIDILPFGHKDSWIHC